MGSENATCLHINFPEASNTKSDDTGDLNTVDFWKKYEVFNSIVSLYQQMMANG